MDLLAPFGGSGYLLGVSKAFNRENNADPEQPAVIDRAVKFPEGRPNDTTPGGAAERPADRARAPGNPRLHVVRLEAEFLRIQAQLGLRFMPPTWRRTQSLLTAYAPFPVAAHPRGRVR